MHTFVCRVRLFLLLGVCVGGWVGRCVGEWVGGWWVSVFVCVLFVFLFVAQHVSCTEAWNEFVLVTHWCVSTQLVRMCDVTRLCAVSAKEPVLCTTDIYDWSHLCEPISEEPVLHYYIT